MGIENDGEGSGEMRFVVGAQVGGVRYIGGVKWDMAHEGWLVRVVFCLVSLLLAASSLFVHHLERVDSKI